MDPFRSDFLLPAKLPSNRFHHGLAHPAAAAATAAAKRDERQIHRLPRGHRALPELRRRIGQGVQHSGASGVGQVRGAEDEEERYRIGSLVSGVEVPI